MPVVLRLEHWCWEIPVYAGAQVIELGPKVEGQCWIEDRVVVNLLVCCGQVVPCRLRKAVEMGRSLASLQDARTGANCATDALFCKEASVPPSP